MLFKRAIVDVSNQRGGHAIVGVTNQCGCYSDDVSMLLYHVLRLNSCYIFLEDVI